MKSKLLFTLLFAVSLNCFAEELVVENQPNETTFKQAHTLSQLAVLDIVYADKEEPEEEEEEMEEDGKAEEVEEAESEEEK